jgi:hypothetical protein
MAVGCLQHLGVVLCMTLPSAPMASNDPGCAQAQDAVVQADNYAASYAEKYPDIAGYILKLTNDRMTAACGDQEF